MIHLPLALRPDPSRVVIRPFMPADDPLGFAVPDCSRVQRIANRVLALDEATASPNGNGCRRD